MTYLPYKLDPDDPSAPPIGVIVLQTDETLEADLRYYFADHPSPIYVTRIRSGNQVTRSSLAQMEVELSAAADLLPKGLNYPVVGYGCTSASSVIGSDRIEGLVQSTCLATAVTNPLRALVTLCQDQNISRLAFLSPYVEDVGQTLRAELYNSGIKTPVFGDFGEVNEANVVRISTASIVDAALSLIEGAEIDAIFLSCTNLRTIEAIETIREATGIPVFSSNQVLAWHMKRLVSVMS
jgi:maleate isomerase